MDKSEPFKKCPLCNGSFKGLGDHIQRTHSIEFTSWLFELGKKNKRILSE